MSASFVATIWQCVPVGMSFPMLELWRSLNDFALQGRRWQWEVPMVLCSTEFKDCSDVVSAEYGPSKLVCAVGLVIGMLSLGFFMSNARAQQEPVPFVQAVPPVPPLPPQLPMPALTVLPVPAALTVRPVAPVPPAPPAPTAAFCATDRGASSPSNSRRHYHRLSSGWPSSSATPSVAETEPGRRGPLGAFQRQ